MYLYHLLSTPPSSSSILPTPITSPGAQPPPRLHFFPKAGAVAHQPIRRSSDVNAQPTVSYRVPNPPRPSPNSIRPLRRRRALPTLPPSSPPMASWLRHRAFPSGSTRSTCRHHARAHAVSPATPLRHQRRRTPVPPVSRFARVRHHLASPPRGPGHPFWPPAKPLTPPSPLAAPCPECRLLSPVSALKFLLVICWLNDFMGPTSHRLNSFVFLGSLFGCMIVGPHPSSFPVSKYHLYGLGANQIWLECN